MRTFPLYLVGVMLTGITPIDALAHSYGPPPRVTGAPGDDTRACTQCHTGSALNSGTGSVKIILQSGPFYVPGVKQRLMVRGSAPGQQRWGFELTARLNSALASSRAGVAGAVERNSWVAGFGPKLCATTRGCAGGAFQNSGMSFSLEGVSGLLTVNNTPRVAYVGYVSPPQVNFLLPSNAGAGTTTVQLKNPAGTTTALPITVQASAPQLFTSDGKSVLGVHTSSVLLGKAAPSAPGETIVVYGTGLGVTSPALIPGVVPADAYPLATLPQVTIGDATATVTFAGYVPGASVVDQINVQGPPG